MKITHKSQKVSQLTKIRDEILLDPAWQRGAVWSPSKKSLLIDSILRGYDIPMIYLRACGNGGPFKFEVVDGQQRLRAIWDYLDDSFKLSKSIGDLSGEQLSGKSYSQLQKPTRDKIKDFKVIVATVSSAREPEISVLFSRMQMGVRLNSPELRNAIQTPLRHCIDAIARENDFFKLSRIPASRFKHQDYLAHAFSISYTNCGSNLKGQQLMEHYTADIENNEILDFSSNALKVLETMSLINEYAKLRLTQKWMFVDIFYYLYCNIHKLDKLDARKFSKEYIIFDKERLQHTKEPNLLLEGEITPHKKDLYNYIVYFKNEGSHKDSLLTRNRVIQNRFEDVWR